MKEVIIRFLSGVLYVAIIFFTLFTSREWFIGLLFILAAFTLNEFLRLVKLKGLIAYLILAISFYFISYKEISTIITPLLLGLTIIVNLFLFRDVMIFNKLRLFKKRRYFCIIFYIISGFVFLSLIPSIEGTFEPKIVLGIFILAWTNDTFAYLAGKQFGKRKLMEKISPKKTIEGFFGGIVGALIASFLFFSYSSLYTLIIWLILAILVSVLGTTGDLIQSKFKRLAGVKDSGKIMPGHGGVYDRLDSIIFASPFIYLFLIIVKYVS
ncbi:MAG: phosphatidate cytidylyltransferase [Flavobacteriaceae bacterium]|nr:phosphatidate cytidylyltransferase [Flavobacteriaceae bacterium]